MWYICSSKLLYGRTKLCNHLDGNACTKITQKRIQTTATKTNWQQTQCNDNNNNIRRNEEKKCNVIKLVWRKRSVQKQEDRGRFIYVWCACECTNACSFSTSSIAHVAKGFRTFWIQIYSALNIICAPINIYYSNENVSKHLRNWKPVIIAYATMYHMQLFVFEFMFVNICGGFSSCNEILTIETMTVVAKKTTVVAASAALTMTTSNTMTAVGTVS